MGLRCEAAGAKRESGTALWLRELLGAEHIPVTWSDSEPQFGSLLFESTCEDLGKTPNLNAHIEAFQRGR